MKSLDEVVIVAEIEIEIVDEINKRGIRMESIGVYRSRDVRPGQDPEKQDARVHLH